MNRYLFFRRLMGPAILLLLGVVALLNQAGIAGWDIFVPLLLILVGIIKLIERAALAAEPYPPGMPPYPGQPGSYAVDPAAVDPARQAASQPSHPEEKL